MKKPRPDGYIHFALVHPVSAWLNHADNKDIPFDIDNEYNIRYDFAEIKSWNQTSHGIVVIFDDRRELIPYTNITSFGVRYNSDKYLTALATFQLQCTHEWEPLVDNDGTNYKLCRTCGVTDRGLKDIQQTRIDEERNLR